jgi:hypothetical protein
LLLEPQVSDFHLAPFERPTTHQHSLDVLELLGGPWFDCWLIFGLRFGLRLWNVNRRFS